MSFYIIAIVLLLAFPEAWARVQEVVVYTSVDKLFSEPILRNFQRERGIRVRVIFDTEEAKSTGIVNRLIAEKDNPRADVFWSGDPVRPILLERRGMLEPYKSPSARDIPEIYKDEEGFWTGFSARARVILYNKGLVGDEEVPKSVYDFLKPQWSGRVAIASPIFGTTSIHAAALFGVLGDKEAEGFFEALKANSVRVVSSNGEVRRLVSRGEVAVGIVDTDDAHVAMLEGKSVGVIYPDPEGMGTLVIPNMVCIIKGGPNTENAKKLVDYLLSEGVEERLAQAECAQMPVRPWVKRPAHVGSLEKINSMSVDYREAATKLEEIYPYLKSWVGY